MTVPFCIYRALRFDKCVKTSIAFSRQCHKQNNPVKNVNSFRKYLLSSYLEYVKNYENALEKRFPSAMRIYRVFKIGITDLYQDMKLFRVVALKTKREGIECLSRHDLEIYYKVPKDMFQIAPVLFISALPLVNYVIFPVAYLFPKQLLTSHFWSLQQKTQFAVADQRHRLKYYKPVFRCLQERLLSLDHHPLHSPWNMAIAMLGSGLHPSSQIILACAPLFSDKPYSLHHLKRKHVNNLLKMHGMHTWWFKRRRLEERARMIQLLDQAIHAEGGVSSLSLDTIRASCFLRGLNPTSMNSVEAAEWLNQWINLSLQLPSNCPSLVLHLPILLAYNHPSNWQLIH